MRKLLTVVLTVFLGSGLFAGCGSNEDAEYLKDLKADKFVTLGQYKGIEISLPAQEVTEEAIDNALASVMMNFPMTESISGPSQAGDTVIIDFIGSLNGIPFDNGAAQDHEYTLGSYQFIADLDDGMIGMSVGDVWDIPVMFPEAYHAPNLAGQEASFKVFMLEIQRPVSITEMTDEYVVWFTEGFYSSLSEFREFMRENLEQEAETAFNNEMMHLLSEQIVRNSEFKPLPAGMVQRINDALTANISYYASMYGLDVQTYMMLTGLLTEGMTAEEIILEQAEMTTRNYIAFQAIADIEGLNITDDEINSGIAEMAAEMGMPVEAYSAGMDIDSFREFLMFDKVTRFLTEHAIITNN